MQSASKTDSLQAEARCFAHRWAAAILSSLAAYAIYLRMGSSSSLWYRDEASFSRAAVEMVQSGNYLYPTLNRDFAPGANPVDYLRADKPIFIYWLMSLTVQPLAHGQLPMWLTSIACRFWSALATAIGCLLIYAM